MPLFCVKRMVRLKSLFFIFGILMIFPLVSNADAFLQTGQAIEAHLNPGESQTFQWGLNAESKEIEVIKLRSEGEGKELLSFPETIVAQPGEWYTVNIIISIPEDYPNDVFLKPRIYATIDQEKTDSPVLIVVQMRNSPSIFIGNPIIEEPVVEEKPDETMEESVVEEKQGESSQEITPFSLESPEEEGGGCLISTATYGSELAPQVQMLREIRDNSLLESESGTAFMSGFNTLYYSFSPTIADLERQSPIFKEAVKITLTPLITSLSILNYVDMDSEAEVLGYGISLILLNVGMYFVAPAILITRLRR